MPENESPIPSEDREFQAPEEPTSPVHEKAYIEKKLDDWLEKKRGSIDMKADEPYTIAALRHLWRSIKGSGSGEKPKEK